MSGLLAGDYVVFDVSPGHFFGAVGTDIPVQAKMLLSYMSSTILGLGETLATCIAVPAPSITCNVGGDVIACETLFGFSITNGRVS